MQPFLLTLAHKSNSRRLSLLQFIPGRALGQCLPSARSGGHPWGRARGTVRSVSCLKQCSCPLSGSFSHQRGIQQPETCPVHLSATSGLVLYRCRAWGCLPQAPKYLLSPSAHACPLLFTCTNFLSLPTSYLTLRLPFISAVADVNNSK